jgi:starch synthase (maltosyl-transferring)
MAWSKRAEAASDADPDGDSDADTVIVVVNLDPHSVREGMLHLNMPELGFDWGDRFVVTDEVTGQTWTWGEQAFVRLDPFIEPAHVLTVRRVGR